MGPWDLFFAEFALLADLLPQLLEWSIIWVSTGAEKSSMLILSIFSFRVSSSAHLMKNVICVHYSRMGISLHFCRRICGTARSYTAKDRSGKIVNASFSVVVL